MGSRTPVTHCFPNLQVAKLRTLSLLRQVNSLGRVRWGAFTFGNPHGLDEAFRLLQQARTKHTCCVGSATQGWQHVRHAPHSDTILCDVSRTETNTAHGNTRLGADQRLCGCSHTGSHACARTAARRHLSAREAPHRKQFLCEKLLAESNSCARRSTQKAIPVRGPKKLQIWGCNPWEMPKLRLPSLDCRPCPREILVL